MVLTVRTELENQPSQLWQGRGPQQRPQGFVPVSTG